MASTTGSDAHDETLDYIRAFRELALVSWRSAVSRKPHGPLLRADPLSDAVELLPGKSLDTRPDGSPWTSGLENVATPASLDDLGSFTLGDRVDAASLLRDGQRILLPYHVSAPHRCHVLVQHEPGHRPTEASFLFVGQRQRVARVCAVPWTEADRLAESLPEATALGPVLFLQMVARCGSTVLCHGMEWMGLGCQSVSEPDVIGDVHEMLERRLCSRADAVRALRTSLLLLIHRLRRDRPAAPMIVIKPRSLTGVWRHCELLPEALPGARQVLQWRRIDHVVGSLDRAIVGGMVSPPTRWLHARGLDGLLWRLQGGAINHFLRRLATTLATEPALEWDRHAGLRLDVDAFAAHGALGFQALNCIFTWHVATVLGPPAPPMPAPPLPAPPLPAPPLPAPPAVPFAAWAPVPRTP